MHHRPRTSRNLAILAGGWAMIVLGLIGLVLPFLQGVLFLAIGVSMLSSVSPRARRLRMRLGARYPIVRRTLAQTGVWQVRIKAWFAGRRWFGRRDPAAAMPPSQS